MKLSFKNHFLVVSVLLVAGVALGYELVQASLSTNLTSNSALQYSLVIGTHLSAMGVGSWLSKYVQDKDLVSRFVQVELLLALLGGCSSLFLSFVYPLATEAFQATLLLVVFMIGALIGFEVPVAMRILGQSNVGLSDVVSRILAVDYLGALIVSLLFPLVMMPTVGIVTSAVIFGIVNLVVAIGTMFVLMDRKPDTKTLVQAAVTSVVLIYLSFNATSLQRMANNQTFKGELILHQEVTQYQTITLTQFRDNICLYLQTNNLQFCSRDEARYHEAFVHPVMSQVPLAKNVLVLGGGDGMAVREVLKYAGVESITLVDLDPRMTELFTQNDMYAQLNSFAYRDEKVTVINADAFAWVRTNEKEFDVIIVDFPDPTSSAIGKLYSVEFYQMLTNTVSKSGAIVVQSTSPYNTPKAFGTINSSIKEAGFNTLPYHVWVPSFGEWGFHLASRSALKGELNIPKEMPNKFLTEQMWESMKVFPADMAIQDQSPSYLGENQIIHRFSVDWSNVSN